MATTDKAIVRAARGDVCSTSAVALDLDGIGKRYGDQWAVEAMTLRVPTGSLVALLGPSGCGKTTTLRMIAGLIAPDTGDVRFDGVSVRDVPPEQREAVMVFQHPTLFAHLDVAANVGFGLKMRRLPRAVVAERVGIALVQVQLEGYGRRKIAQLSGGQQQRVALARALVTAPRLLLLDEPLSSLDPSLRDEMRDLIAHLHAAQGITTVLVTHDRTEAMTLADRIAVLHRGSLRQYDTPTECYERPATPSVARFFGMTNLLTATITGRSAQTPLGTFALPAGGDAAGEMLVGIRPEHITLGDGQNRISGTVTARTYLGLHQQLMLRCGDTLLTVLAPADAGIRTGDTLTVCLPPGRLHLLPSAG